MFCWHIVVEKRVESKRPMGRPERSLILLQISVSLSFFLEKKEKEKEKMMEKKKEKSLHAKRLRNFY